MKKLLNVCMLVGVLFCGGTLNFNASQQDNIEDLSVSVSSSEILNSNITTKSSDELVYFEDENLERAISKKLDVPVGEITPENMKSLTKLNLDNEEINDLTGIEYATNLTEVNLALNEVSDLSPLEKLYNLESLDLSYNNIDDLTPLSALLKLSELNLEKNEISSLDGLNDLENLNSLNLSHNKISDLSPLSELNSLTNLDLFANEITDLSPIKGLTNLQSLSLIRNEITNLTYLSNLDNLLYLNLDENKVSDLTPLSSLNSIEVLSLDTNKISDLSPLSELVNLEKLSLEENQISDLSPLSNLLNLKYLYLSMNEISDLSPLYPLENISNTSLKHQEIQLEELTVNNKEEIFYNVIDVNGNKTSISLGYPIDGTVDLENNWYLSTSIGTMDAVDYQGHIYQTVTYSAISELTGNVTANSYEEVILSDKELIELFDVKNSDNQHINVNQSSINYSVPGEYEVIFTDEDGNELIGTLNILDILPTLTIDKDVVSIFVEDTIEDVLKEIEYTATEITEGDLTNNVMYDDSQVDYLTVGEYTIRFTVEDEEKNSVSKSLKVIVRKEEGIIDPIEPEVVDPIEPEVVDPIEPEVVDPIEPETGGPLENIIDTIDNLNSDEEKDNKLNNLFSEVNEEEQMNDKQDNKLVISGGKLISVISLLITLVVILIGLKLWNRLKND